ncbi:MAG: restriction endonuclease [Candidatus Kapaibacterium sp.]|nr:restriction endonuclease [Ignavibacteriota bacterium]
MILDFKEIPQANKANGYQDTFELFARDFLEVLGYEIIQQPDRGADGKKDLIVQELRHGLSGTTKLKWLVSCKHKAFSGKSVSDTDEPNIQDRLTTYNCEGFIGFYSTLPSTGLGGIIQGLKSKIETQTFDREQIEKVLLESPQGLKLASRYFPKSYADYIKENPKPIKLFSESSSINCDYCSKDLLENKSGIFVMLKKSNDVAGVTTYSKAYFSCKGAHDRILKNRYTQREQFIDSWIDISDYTSPIGYIKRIMAWMNFMQGQNHNIDDDAYIKIRKLILNTFPFISREQTTQEVEYIKELEHLGLQDFY